MKSQFSFQRCRNIFLMALLRSKTKLAAVNKDTRIVKGNILGTSYCETQRLLELMRSASHKFPRKLERRVTKRVSHEFSRTKSRILGTLSKLDEFLFYAHKSRCNREPLRELPGRLTEKSRNVTKIFHRMILILKKWLLKLIGRLTEWSQTMTRTPHGQTKWIWSSSFEISMFWLLSRGLKRYEALYPTLCANFYCYPKCFVFACFAFTSILMQFLNRQTYW